MEINEMVRRVHETAKQKGWWDVNADVKNIHVKLALHMLMVTEIAEASEVARMGGPAFTPGCEATVEEDFLTSKKTHHTKTGPEGEAIELADVVIRIADYFGANGWDLEKMLEEKMKYNLTRTSRHGGKLA